jgi:hypothetical protein
MEYYMNNNNNNLNEKIKGINEEIKELKYKNLLLILIKLLNKIGKNSNENEMTIQTLGKIFTPKIFKKK